MFITRHNHPYLLHPDEAAGGAGQAPPNEGTPDNTGLEQAGTQQPDIPAGYIPEDRYKEAQAWGTRSSQEASQLRQQVEQYQQLLYADDPDTRRMAAEALGIELADNEIDDTQQGDPYGQLQAELAQLKEQVHGDRQQAQQQQQIAALEVATDNAMNAIQVPDNEQLRDWIVSRAVALPPTDQGLPDVKAAWEEYQALITSEKKSWAGSKRTHQFSGVGGEGTQVPDLNNRQQRVDYMTSRLMADEQQ